MLALLCATPARALSLKWVANTGTDGAACGTLTSPCRTFQQAHDNVANGGEIGVLTPGDYGTFVISKSVSVTNDGSGEASVLVGTNSTGIKIAAGVGDVIGLRGLIVDGEIVGTFGIYVQQAAAVHIQNCVIRNLEGGGYGITYFPQSNSQLFVSDTIVYNNGSSAASGGIAIYPFGPDSSLSINAVLNRVRVENNVVGIRVDGSGDLGGGAHVVVRDSVVSGNVGDGILAISTPRRAPAFVVVERTSVVNNAGIGIHADGPGATMLLNDDTITRNGTGIGAVNGGQLISYGNNKNNNNIGPEGSPTGFYSPM